MPNEKPTSSSELLRFRYKNWKGEISDRTVIPIRTSVLSSQYHNDGKPCWIMTAYDVDKQDTREFALKDIIEYYDILGS